VSKTYDLLNMGRSSIDLYSNDVGTPFVDIGSFAAYVGGSPTNISVGARRLGLKTVYPTQAAAPDKRRRAGHRAAGQIPAGLLP
jgi:hypothetical protein